MNALKDAILRILRERDEGITWNQLLSAVLAQYRRDVRSDEFRDALHELVDDRRVARYRDARDGGTVHRYRVIENSLKPPAVVARVPCPVCNAPRGQACWVVGPRTGTRTRSPHKERFAMLPKTDPTTAPEAPGATEAPSAITIRDVDHVVDIVSAVIVFLSNNETVPCDALAAGAEKCCTERLDVRWGGPLTRQKYDGLCSACRAYWHAQALRNDLYEHQRTR